MKCQPTANPRREVRHPGDLWHVRSGTRAPARQAVRAVTVSPRRLRFQGAGCYTSDRLPRPWQTYDASPRTPTPPRVAWGGIDLSRYVDAIANAILMTVP